MRRKFQDFPAWMQTTSININNGETNAQSVGTKIANKKWILSWCLFKKDSIFKKNIFSWSKIQFIYLFIWNSSIKLKQQMHGKYVKSHPISTWINKWKRIFWYLTCCTLCPVASKSLGTFTSRGSVRINADGVRITRRGDLAFFAFRKGWKRCIFLKN